MAKAKQITNEQRQKVITDYAIATGVKRSYNLNDNNEATGAYVVDEKVTKNGERKITYVTANGILKDNGTQTTGLGAAPVVNIPLSRIVLSMIETNLTAEKLLKIRQIGEDYVIELGLMPKTRAEDAVQALLAADDPLQHAGKFFSIEGDYDKSYKAVTISAAEPDVVARYADETIDENGKVVAFEVEPIKFVITNYADLPPMFNPNGTGKAETLDLTPAQIIMSYDEYNKEKENFVNDELLNTESISRWTKKKQDAIIKLISQNPANVNIIPASLILDDKFMAKVNEVLAESYQKEFKAGMKKKDAKKIKKEAKNTSQLISNKVEKAKAEKAAEEAKAKAEEEARAKEEEEKKRPAPTEDKKDKKEKKAKKEKKPEGKIKKKLKNMLSLAKDAFSKLGTLSDKKADSYQKEVDEMFSTLKSTKPAQAKPKNNTPKAEQKKEEHKAEPKTEPEATPKKKRPAGAAEDDRTK